METKVETKMPDDNVPAKKKDKGTRGSANQGILGGTMFLAFIGAAVYYIQQATSFWMGVLGFFKAIVWPALVMYRVLELLAMK